MVPVFFFPLKSQLTLHWYSYGWIGKEKNGAYLPVTVPFLRSLS